MKLCLVSNCEEKHLSRGLCGTHYAQLRRGVLPGQMTPFEPRWIRRINAGKKCKVKDCERNAERALMCMAHYQRVQTHRDPMAYKPIRVNKGRHYHKTGYIVIPAKGHANGNAAGSIMEHIKIMSEHLGRPLQKNENVHHRNGIRDDNRIENLELWTRHQPTGTRVRDLIIFARKIIKDYGDDETKF